MTRQVTQETSPTGSRPGPWPGTGKKKAQDTLGRRPFQPASGVAAPTRSPVADGLIRKVGLRAVWPSDQVLPRWKLLWSTGTATLVGPVFKMCDVGHASPVCLRVDLTPLGGDKLVMAAPVLALSILAHPNRVEGRQGQTWREDRLLRGSVKSDGLKDDGSQRLARGRVGSSSDAGSNEGYNNTLAVGGRHPPCTLR